jgi:hypothetical protein
MNLNDAFLLRYDKRTSDPKTPMSAWLNLVGGQCRTMSPVVAVYPLRADHPEQIYPSVKPVITHNAR